ncbi:MAG: hypothetical protein ACT4QA_02465 [Panacagrimonas sp.]
MRSQKPIPPMSHFSFRALAWFLILALAAINATAFVDVANPVKRVGADVIGMAIFGVG